MPFALKQEATTHSPTQRIIGSAAYDNYTWHETVLQITGDTRRGLYTLVHAHKTKPILLRQSD